MEAMHEDQQPLGQFQVPLNPTALQTKAWSALATEVFSGTAVWTQMTTSVHRKGNEQTPARPAVEEQQPSILSTRRVRSVEALLENPQP